MKTTSRYIRSFAASTGRLFAGAASAAAKRVAGFAVYLWRRPTRTKIKVVAVIIAVVVLVGTPSVQGGTEILQLPANGEEVRPSTVLAESRLYKLKVSGTVVGAADGRRFDAQFFTKDDPFDTPRDSIVIDGEPVHADLMDPEDHVYTYYVPGRGRKVSLRFRDEIAPGVDGGYFDNRGALEVELSEAEFRCWADDNETAVAGGATFHYTLDPIPRSGDIVVLEIYHVGGRGRELVFRVDSDRFIDGAVGFPQRLTKYRENTFEWFGYGNVGSYAYRAVVPGIYDAKLTVESGEDKFTAFPPDLRKEFLRIAVLPGAQDPRYNVQVVLPENEKGKPYFPYYSPRAAHPIYGPVLGVDGVYVTGEEEPAEPNFIYYCPADREGRPVNSPAVFYVKRMINVALSSLDEADPSYTYEPMTPLNAVFDDELVEKLAELRTRLPYDTSAEENLLWELDNLPPAYGIAATEDELGRIVGKPTVEHLLNTTIEIRGVPAPVPISYFDNMKGYDPEDPYRSAYHTFHEVGKRVNAEYRQFTPAPANLKAIIEGKRYDINDADFVALMMAVCYQECGFVHRTQSGLIYRAGKGRGSATGYMQCTADLIKGTRYKITLPTDNGLASVRLNQLPTNSKYAVRNVARFNIEIGAAFLREMLNQPAASTWHSAIRSEMSGSGVLSFGSRTGTINRVKLTGAMYNAGPATMKVILNEVYDEPGTTTNEGVAYFLNDCEGDVEPFLERFREDLDRYRKGLYTFPIQERGAAGEERLRKLVHWLGPYWYKKKAPVTWDEAALMKLDVEVIPYVQGLSTNFKKFRKNDDYYFKTYDFSGLWHRPKKKAAPEEVVRPWRGLRYVFLNGD
ncbi:MAG: hypothetical protein JSW52_08695 [Candidatus Coatesbacteria bacterium]|nr:MAG: hypothetical protein JSW52_08695 [Candidatus Coatesbacteria bacterium]